jgi:hypothetical protein
LYTGYASDGGILIPESIPVICVRVEWHVSVS